MADTKAPRRLDEALRPGGLYYTVDGTAHDAHGNVLEGAPKRPENTNPEDQPFAKIAAMSNVGPGGSPAGLETLGLAIARGLRMAANDESPDEQPRKATADNVTTRDELAATAADATVKPNTPTVDARVIPALTPGGEAAAAAASSGAPTPTSTSTTIADDTGASSSAGASTTDNT